MQLEVAFGCGSPRFGGWTPAEGTRRDGGCSPAWPPIGSPTAGDSGRQHVPCRSSGWTPPEPANCPYMLSAAMIVSCQPPNRKAEVRWSRRSESNTRPLLTKQLGLRDLGGGERQTSDMVPARGVEPRAWRLSTACSTVELREHGEWVPDRTTRFRNGFTGRVWQPATFPTR